MKTVDLLLESSNFENSNISYCSNDNFLKLKLVVSFYIRVSMKMVFVRPPYLLLH